MSNNSNPGRGATSLGSGQSNLDYLTDMPTFETVARRHLLNSTVVSRAYEVECEMVFSLL